MNADVEHERELREEWQRSHMARHELEQKANSLAYAQLLEWKKEVNQVRAQIDGERNLFLRRESYDEQHASLRDAIDVRLKSLENIKSNLEGRMWAMGAGISAVVVVVNFVIYYLSHR